eukprot:TRINITY_DN5945_c0_g1_i1.p1 TRINITY_DN5945_c0_g1~~TRINITY_DN5945_c0_g1_i1.p1  ORF type:complete len:997 (+),score=218.37 TRINITY_DN5945_c0_g1_i1:308-3298(+)
MPPSSTHHIGVPMATIPWNLALCLSLYFSIFLIQTRVLVALDPFSEALLGLKSELVDASNSLHDWAVPSKQNSSSAGTISACSWSGITCTKNSSMIIGLDISQKNLSGSVSGNHIKVLIHLVDLNLSSNSFSGELPAEMLTSLTNLRSLDISRNNFNGSFPDGISAIQHLVILDAFSNSFSGPLPAEAARLKNLKILNLAGSYFEGPIPKEFGSFQSLEFLHLAGNWLSGEIPIELGNLRTVTHMEIGYNLYQGSVPWQLGNMTKLEYLDIAQANLSGSVPPYLGNLTHLQSLFLFSNRLSGSIPNRLGNATLLESIDLSVNLLSGSIPESFAALKNLRLLSLMYNDMTGSIPEGIAELPSLDSLFIWNNRFSGALPQSLGRNSQLKSVDVSTNAFEGVIPAGLCAGGKLAKLMLFSNRFTGGLSAVLSNCPSLVRLRIEDNSFSGVLPLQFGGVLKNVTYVDVSRNQFTGGIPDDIYKAEKLQYFNISHNPGLGGRIPEKLWSLPLLQNFSAASCNISGNIPPFESCKSVSVIELSGNHLSGRIPNGIFSCRVLEKLDLKKNRLMGTIPPELANLYSLSILDLSYNGFTGPIPEKLGNSSSLVLLNMSFNNISGSIPSSGALRLMGANAFVGNPNLCGAPLPQTCADSKAFVHVGGLGFGSKGAEKLTWVLLLCSGIVLLIVISVSAVLYTRKCSEGQWRMVSFTGLPQFTVSDVLRSLSCYRDSTEFVSHSSALFSKAVLPTGISVAVKKIELNKNRTGEVLEFITQMGNARHRNLVRLLGYCSNKKVVYLLYDCLANGNLGEKIGMKRDPAISTWAAKYKVVVAIARGLCFLHHDCHPAIPHGDLRSSNIMFDENMEPHLGEFGIKRLLQMNGGGSAPGKVSKIGSVLNTGEPDTIVEEEIYSDIYSFGELLLEILTNGRLITAEGSIQSKPRDTILREIYDENEGGVAEESREEIKLVLEVAVLCTRSMPSDRPSMEDALRLLSGLRPHRKQ